MNRQKKKGFTLVELVVVLVIMTIIIGIAIPSVLHYMKMAEFRKNEENAKTIYLAAESKLTYYRTSGQWEEFQKKVLSQGQEAPLTDSKLQGKIYGITLDKENSQDASVQNNAVLELLDDYTYDKDMLNASIGIEIDIESGEVYSAFYGTRCKGLTYESKDSNGYLTMMLRDYDSRKDRVLGYYSVEDTVHVVALKPTRLKVNSISLLNSETLSLNWSSNMGNNLDVEYDLEFYQKAAKSSQEDQLLFTMAVDPVRLREQGWDVDNSSSRNMVSVEIKDAEGNSKGNWYFPISIQDGKYVLTLDAMMSAEVIAALDGAGENKAALEQTTSTSICRLKTVAKSLENPQNIYVSVQAVAGSKAAQEYRSSEKVTSNTANTMFADDSKTGKETIAYYRHLSNLRYYKEETANFTLTSRNMDWTAIGTGVYEFSTEKTTDGNNLKKIVWHANDEKDMADFPTVNTLPKGYTLTGKGKNTKITNLSIGEDSVLKDSEAEKMSGVKKASWIGMFGEVEGTVENVTFQDPKLELTADTENKNLQEVPVEDHDALKGAGILAGRSEGNLDGIQILVKEDSKEIVRVSFDGERKAAGIGGVVGVLAKEDKDGALSALQEVTVSDISVEGKIQGNLPEAVSQEAKDCTYGIGGIVGYAYLNNQKSNTETVVKNCENHGDIYGNYVTGGIVGNLHGTYKKGTLTQEQIKAQANIVSCSSDGLIQATADAGESGLNGKYFGGIAGYGYQTLLYDASSASGRSSKYSYDASKKNQLRGDYVGGIIGYGEDILLSDCSTKKKGYVLGADYVGGIAGGLNGEIQSGGEVLVTTNASYVIGKSYVGGIVGKNTGEVTIQNCINNGVAAGYERYIGGITGYNDATIEDCASYLSDYSSSTFRMIVSTWNATGDFVGGITGYNNGTIKFNNDSEKVTVKSVSSIVVGNNYVGGIAGFNDVQGTLDVHYTLIGGRIYAYGDCAGGGFGLNASEELLTRELTMKPSSVQGRYYVGGCIGANVVDLKKDTVMSGFRADNRLGSVTGEAYVGGVIGYQRTYSAQQLTQAGGSTTAIVEAVVNNRSLLLPELKTDNTPDTVLQSANEYKLTITQKNNTTTKLTTAGNNIPLRGYLYVGGIIGYSEKTSKLEVLNSLNTGNIGVPTEETYTDSQAKKGVNLAAFVSAQVDERTLAQEAQKITLHPSGGIIGVNLKGQTITNCENQGTITGYNGIGGIVGLNAGTVNNCNLTDNFGSVSLSYIGGISGINMGTVSNCTTNRRKTVSGRNCVGGITGWNLNGGIVKDSISASNINGDGNNIGGIAGQNSGSLQIEDESQSSPSRTIRGQKNVGGITGVNEAAGMIQVVGSKGEQVAVGTGVTVNGTTQVGGITGYNQGTLQGTSSSVLVSKAGRIRATQGIVGGIAGKSEGTIAYAANRSNSVQADQGEAGGITGTNLAGHTVTACINYGNVTSSDGYAGGIAAANAGDITDCQVKAAEKNGAVRIQSRGVKESGAVCGVNTGVISGSTQNAMVDDTVTLSGSGTVYGGITGINQGTITGVTIRKMPVLNSQGSSLTVGGIAGTNEGEINQTKAELEFNDFTNYRYLGGIAGENKTGTICNCTFTGRIKEKSGSAENCYGGITGLNEAVLRNCHVEKIYMDINGVYTATSTSTAQQKEKMATHAGGVAGKNETGAIIEGCTIENREDSQLIAQYGMLGGITGYNKGSVRLSGAVEVQQVYNGATTVEQLHENVLQSKAVAVDTAYIQWDGSKNNALENVVYNGTDTKVSDYRMKLYMDKNGNLGGIVAFNSTQGSVDKCMSGNWFLANKSTALGVGTGGIIGMNESEKDMSGLVNGAFVGRQLPSADTDRFAGGIIGNQNNSTSSDWVIKNCINYGTVYCYNTHYSGGIMGQWTGSGGTIQNCRNYGLMQTTINSGWYGASAGIVAQLYHAYEGQTYNIIGCNNYGSLYRKNGADGEGANDSAGILGNITTYKVNNQKDGQSFNVQILDCANEPGAEIYSSSMASGIFGFLSCDNADVSSIEKSTCNVKIRVERCRNFGSVLKGNNYAAGIFGDRYSTAGWQNTVVKDNYSVHLPAGNYNGGQGGNGYPVFGHGNSGAEGNSTKISAQNQGNNFYLENVETWGFTNVKIGEDQESLGMGSGEAGNGMYEAGLNNRNIANLFVMYDVTRQQYFLAEIRPSVNSDSDPKLDYMKYYGPKTSTMIKGVSQYIDTSDFFIKATDGTKLAKVITYLEIDQAEMQKYLSVNDFAANAIQVPDNAFFNSLRESFRRLEGIKDGGILAPQSAQAQIADGKVTMQITPQSRSEKDTDLNQTDQLYDPFMYEVKVSSNGKETIQKIYSENETFTLPSGMDGEVSIQVRAVSMFEDVEPSQWITLSAADINRVLPDPDVEIHLIEDSTAGRGYNYEYSLKNLDAYNAKDEKTGETLYPDWQVTVRVQGLGEVVLDAEHPTRTLQADNTDSPIYQMVAKASSRGSNILIQDSKEISTPIYIPYYYRPQICLNTWTDQILKTSWKVTGDTLENLNVEVTLDASGAKAMNTPPIYRVELVGNWKGTEDTVLAKEDVLIVSKGSVTATFSGLPAYLSEAKDIRLRIWYAASGLGPVYTYYPLEQGDSGVNVQELTGIDEDGTEQWAYSHSTVLSEYSKNYRRQNESVSYFDPYIYNSSENIWTWLPAPVLDGADSDTMLTPEITADGKIYYTFSWDTGVSGTANASYQTELTGIDGKGREVTIDTADAYKGGKSLRIEATDWNYESVKLKVTRIGDEKKREIGLSTTGTYQIRQRLEAPGQPSVDNMDVNELDYQVTWASIASETGCSGYQAYIRVYGADDQLEEAKELGTFIKAGDTTDGVYKERLLLDESYAGKTAVIYVVAKADINGSYLDSVAGVTCQLTIPERLATPEASWSVNWTYDKSKPVEAEAFRNGGLEVSLKNATVPPGGSGYLLKGYVYNSEAEAQSAGKAGDPGQGAVAVYPASGNETTTPVEMDMDRANAYHHDLEDFSIDYAGKYIVFYTRISSGDGKLSSLWIHSDTYRLPYVKLEQPEVTSDSRSETVTAYTTVNPDLPQTAETWNVTNTVLKWNSVEGADMYQLDLQGTIQTTSGNNILNRQINSKIRVMENYKNQLLTVQQQDEHGNWMTAPVTDRREEIPTADPQKPRVIHHFTLDSYQTTVQSGYLAGSTQTYYTVTLSAELLAEEMEDGTFAYTLVLPDAEAMSDGAGNRITNANFSLTDKVTVESNVVSNIWPTDLTGDTKDNPDQKPEEKPYSKSDPLEVTFR